MKYPILDDVGRHFIDRAAELVTSGHKFVYVLDNIDWEEKAHDMRKDAQNRSVHAMATSIVFSRVSNEGLPDSGAQQDLKDCNVHQLVDINLLELDAIRSRYRILVAKLLFEHFPVFAMFKPYMAGSTSCRHSKEMSNWNPLMRPYYLSEPHPDQTNLLPMFHLLNLTVIHCVV
mgnify:CR=1 FL=1